MPYCLLLDAVRYTVATHYDHMLQSLSFLFSTSQGQSSLSINYSLSHFTATLYFIPVICQLGYFWTWL